MKRLLQFRFARPAALALLLGLVLLFGASGTTWAYEERWPGPRPNRPGGSVPPRQADLAIDKQGAWTGESINFIIRVTNLGPTVARSVVVDDFLPRTISYRWYTASQGTCRLRNDVLRCDVGNLRVGQEVRIVVRARVDRRVTRVVTNVATTRALTADPSYRNNIASVTVTRP